MILSEKEKGRIIIEGSWFEVKEAEIMYLTGYSGIDRGILDC